MSEEANYRHWNDSDRGVYEVWYLTWNDPATEQGYWLRYVTEAPVEGHGDPRGELWFARFDPHDPSRTFGIRRHVALTQVASGEKPFALSVGGSRLAHDHAAGQLAGDGHDVRWDLRWEPAAETLRIYPDLMYLAGGVAPTTPQMPNWRVPLSGALVIDGETIRFDRVPMGQTHLWGKKHGYTWTWAHCIDFHEAPDASLEIIAGRLHRRGMTSPPLLALALDVGGEQYRFNQLRHFTTNRASWESCKVRVQAWSPLVKVEGELTCTPERMINAQYIDPDGTEVWCANTEIGDAKFSIYKRAGMGWKLDRTLEATRRAHFEVGGRTRDPAVTREHKLVR